MPYITGVLLEAGQTEITAENTPKILEILNPIMRTFFDEEPDINYVSGSNQIEFTTPLGMSIFLSLIHGNWFFRLMDHVNWVLADDYGSVADSDLPLMYHVAVNNENTVMSLGVGVPSIGEPFFTVTIIKTGGSYIAIQHGVSDIRSSADTTWVKDAYHKSETDCQIMSARASGGYYSDSKLALVPAIDPWTGDAIPDLYISLLRPVDTRQVRNLISVNNRQLISGVVSDSGTDKYNKAMPTFVKI